MTKVIENRFFKRKHNYFNYFFRALKMLLIYTTYFVKYCLFLSISRISCLYVIKMKLREKKTIFLSIIFKRNKKYFTKSNFENKFIQYSSIFSEDLFMNRVHREFLTCLVSLTNRHKKTYVTNISHLLLVMHDLH